MASQSETGASPYKHPYHLVDPSPWPLLSAFAGGALVLGIIFVAHSNSYWLLGLGLASTLVCMFFWWRDIIKESRTPGLHTPVVRIGLRYGMVLFIASEVMFFVAFFWAYFHFALYPEHVAGAENPVWPPHGVLTFDPFHLPFLNTMILLLSGCTVTWAHHALLQDDRRSLIAGLALTVFLGISFTGFQIWELRRGALPVHRRHLSLHLLPRHRLPRLPRLRRHLLPGGLPGPRHPRPFLAAAPFRL
jgi:cytochrome c oxidase subunit 3